jgi:YVTN family beta-propeller protein
MSVAALDLMGEALTRPYQRGLERRELSLGAPDPAGVIPVMAYDFADYLTHYGRLPDSPGYLLIPRVPIVEEAAMRVWYVQSAGQPEQSAVVRIPAGTTAGLSFAVPVAPPAPASLRITRLEPLTADFPAGAPSTVWRVVALLGTLAKLLWVIGREHEVISAQVADVRAQRTRGSAHGVSLDLLGTDLGVPRFPPSAYSFDDDTIALYHLDDEPVGPQEVSVVRDERERHAPGSGHNAQNGDPAAGIEPAASRARGRFARAFAFGAGGAAITIPDHADFALPAAAGADLTAEAMIRPDATGGTGAVLAKREDLDDPSKPGWSITVGRFRGVRANVRFSVGDGTPSRSARLFGDVDLADGTYHHVAAVLERRPPGAMLRLLVDGRERAQARMPQLGALTNTEPVVIGHGTEGAGTAPYTGLVDEVRLSRVARPSFHPVLGEGDEQYRARQGIFERWVVPTPQAIEESVNELVQISGTARSFRVVEDDNDIALATRPLRVEPKDLGPGSCIAADGNMRPVAAAVVGTQDEDPDFDPAWLVEHPKFPLLMHAAAAEALTRLDARLPAGTLDVTRAYDPASPGLHPLGRALTLRALGGLELSHLAIAAHAVGFDLVCRRDPDVHASVARSEALRIAVAQPPQPAPQPGIDVLERSTVKLRLRPDPPRDSDVRWLLVRCGEGDATLGAPRRTATGAAEIDLTATRAGRLSVRAEVTRHRRRATGTLDLRVGVPRTGPGSLTVNESIANSGRRGVPEGAATGGDEAPFHPAYLTYSDLPGVDYGTDPLLHRMQRVTARALATLVAGLAPGQTITIDTAYVPGATTLHGLGRALVLTGNGISSAALAGLAHASGFDYVRVDSGPVVYAACAPGELIDIEGATSPLTVGVENLQTVSAAPRATPSAVAVLPDGSGALIAAGGNDVLSFVPLEGPPGRMPRASVADAALVGHRPTSVAVTPDGQRAFVGHSGGDHVTVVDLATLTATADISGGLDEPRLVAVVPDGSLLIIGCYGDLTVHVFDAPSETATGVVAQLPGRPLGMVPTPDSTQAWVACEGVNLLTLVDLGSGAVNQQLSIAGPASAVALSTDGALLYAALPAAGRVVVIDVASSAPVAQVAVPGDPSVLAITPDETQVWIASPAVGQLRVLSTQTNTLEPTILPLAREPVALAATPVGTAYRPTVLAAARAGSDVTLLDPTAIAAAGGRSPISSTLLLGSGLGERLSWAVIPAPLGQASLSSAVAETVEVTGREPGAALVRAISSRPGRTAPYEFELRLVPALEQPSTVVRKDQYDIVMNVLNSLHPVGVEVRTHRVREHVVEVAEGMAEALPGYTFPPYRTGGPPLPPTRDERT